ncbi:hypothetical protein POTOM_040902 [Populus tomentosa]|uniref:ABL domain-containing protein n=1 Tax=Populus tomentosa TaxID=118781 RepID=A0A8X7YUZ3_POPTO|nr:hypothetical protein POTOM_040902 [Populus tomentosa]
MRTRLKTTSSRHPVLVLQAPFGLSPPYNKYPVLTNCCWVFWRDVCAGSRAEIVFPHLAASPPPGTLAGGSCSWDGIMGSDFVITILFLVRDLEEDLLPTMIQICHLVLTDRFSGLPLLGSSHLVVNLSSFCSAPGFLLLFGLLEALITLGCHVFLTWRFLNGVDISMMIDYWSKWSLSLSEGLYILAGWFALLGDDVLDLENYQLVAVITQETFVLLLYAAWLTMVFTVGGGSLIISLVADACFSLPPGWVRVRFSPQRYGPIAVLSKGSALCWLLLRFISCAGFWIAILEYYAAELVGYSGPRGCSDAASCNYALPARVAEFIRVRVRFSPQRYGPTAALSRGFAL